MCFGVHYQEKRDNDGCFNFEMLSGGLRKILVI